MGNKIEKIPLTEYMKTDSKYSAMRLAFFWIVKTIIAVALTSTIAIIVCSIFSIKLDATALVTIITALSVTAFGGKALQSKAENPSGVSTDSITQTLQTSLTAFAEAKKASITPEDTKSEDPKKDPNDLIAPKVV